MKKPAALFLFFFLSQTLVPEGFARQESAQPPKDLAPVQNSVMLDEAQIGEQIHRTIMSSFYPYTEPKANEYITKIGEDLARQAARRELDYRFIVLYSDKIYATSSPGGYVYITTGMIYFLENEAELAAVMAHEIAQLQYKDPKVSVGKKVLKNVTEKGATIAPMFGQIGALATVGFALLHSAATLGNKTPEQRLAIADKKAMSYMEKSGYDPQGMIDLFYKFADADKEVMPYFMEYYESRPLTDDRVLAVEEEFAKLPLEGKNFDVHRQKYLDETRGIREIYKTA